MPLKTSSRPFSLPLKRSDWLKLLRVMTTGVEVNASIEKPLVLYVSLAASKVRPKLFQSNAPISRSSP